ncbi:WD repeat-containing protein wrap73 [Coelomomyces lativittatus]|nr:WD repeat-containing protein wrap73 [Coelomomyces lativittatus]
MDFSDVYKHHHHLVTFSPDQRYLTAVVGHKLILRDAETLHMLHVIHLSTPTTTPTPPSTSTTVLSWVSFSPDSLYVLCASYDEGWIQVWTLDGHEPVASIHEGLAGCVKVMWHPRHRSVLSWSHAHLRISIWNLMESQLHYLPRPKHVHEGFSFRNDGMYFALLSREECKDCVCIYETVDWGLVNVRFSFRFINGKREL